MYRVYYNDQPLHVPYSDDAVYNAKITCEVNASAYFDFTVSIKHSMYEELSVRGGKVRVYSDDELIFDGIITDYADNSDGERDVSCVSVLNYLNDTVVRPYSTTQGEYSLYIKDCTPANYFEWLIDQHNQNVKDSKHFKVGVNEADELLSEDSDETIVRSSSQLPTTADELSEKLLEKLGGYLTLSYDINGNYVVNLYSNTPGLNDQIIDFGENIIEFERTVDTSDLYTAIRPIGGSKEDDEGNEGEGASIAGMKSPTDTDPDDPLEDNVSYEFEVDRDLYKSGDVIFSRSAVSEYGYIEYGWDGSDATIPLNLYTVAIGELKQHLQPLTSITVKAVDLSLYMEGYTHLLPGQMARVRAEPWGVDEFLLVNSMELDINDPENTTYTLGRPPDRLSTEIAELNSTIKEQSDTIDSLTQDVKDAASAAESAEQRADEAEQRASEAEKKAQQAQDAAEQAQELMEDEIKTETGQTGDKLIQLDPYFPDHTFTANSTSSLYKDKDIAISCRAPLMSESAESSSNQGCPVVTGVFGNERYGTIQTWYPSYGIIDDTLEFGFTSELTQEDDTWYTHENGHLYYDSTVASLYGMFLSTLRYIPKKDGNLNIKIYRHLSGLWSDLAITNIINGVTFRWYVDGELSFTGSGSVLRLDGTAPPFSSSPQCTQYNTQDWYDRPNGAWTDYFTLGDDTEHKFTVAILCLRVDAGLEADAQHTGGSYDTVEVRIPSYPYEYKGNSIYGFRLL